MLFWCVLVGFFVVFLLNKYYYFFYYFDYCVGLCVLDPLVPGGLTPFCRWFSRFCRRQTFYPSLIEIERFWCVGICFFLCFSYQLMVSLFYDRTFVSIYSSRSTPFLYPFVSFFCTLFIHNKTPLCVVSCLPQPPPLSSTRVLSPRKNLPVLCVSSWIYSYSFDHFLCVFLCLLTQLHPSASIRTHPHPFTPNCTFDCPSVYPPIPPM